MKMPSSPPDLDALLAHSGWVRSLARSLVLDAASADDIEQQAWVAAIEHPPAHGSNLRSWWTSVVRNVAGMGWRAERRRRQATEALAGQPSDAEVTNPVELAARRESFRHLAQAVLSLPDPYGEAIYLRYFEEMPVREVARRQAVPVDTAQSRLRVGLEHLRTTLQQELGQQWRAHCQALVFPLTTIPSIGTGTGLTVGAKTVAWSFVLLLVCSILLVWAPWREVPLPSAGDSPLGVVTAHGGPPADPESPSSPALVRVTEPSAATTGGAFQHAAANGPRITVVDQSTLQPLPEAQILAIDLAGGGVSEDSLVAMADRGAWLVLRILGKAYLTDAQGTVRIPRPQGRLLLIGANETHYGNLHGRSLSDRAAADGDIRLEIAEVGVVKVQVVDEQGKPVVGAQVGLGEDDGEFLGGLLNALTDATGLARIRIVDAIRREEHGALFAQLAILSAQPIQVAVDLNALPVEALTLQMPPTGRVELQMPPGEDVEMEKSYFSGLAALTSERDGRGQRKAGDETLVGHLDQDRFVFPYVALHRDLRGSLLITEEMLRAVGEAQGPGEAGETVVIPLKREGQSFALTGRILNTEGMVAKNLHLQLETTSTTGTGVATIRRDILTDREGRFRLSLSGEDAASEYRQAVIIMPPTRRKPRRIAEMELHGFLSSGETDLGDCVVDDAPLLVKGVVRDAQGSAVAKVAISVEAFLEDGVDFRDFSTRGRPGGGVIFSPEPGWTRCDDLATNTDESGQFSILAQALPGHYRLSTRHNGHPSVHVAFAPGEADVEVRFAPDLEIRGRVLLDPAIDPTGVYAYLLTPKPDQPGEYYGEGTFLDRKGFYSFSGKRPGRYALRIRSGDLEEEFFFAPEQDIDLSSEVFTYPTVDLRGQLHMIRATVVDADGALLPEGRIGLPDSIYPGIFFSQPIPLVSRQSHFNLEFSAEGKHSVVLHGVDEDQRVVLQDGIPVQIVLSNLDLLPPDWDLSVAFVAIKDDESLAGSSSGSIRFSKSPRGRVSLAWPGRYRLRMQVWHARHNDSIHEWIALPGEEDSPEFRVKDGSELQEFTLSLSATALAEAVQAGLKKEMAWDLEHP